MLHVSYVYTYCLTVQNCSTASEYTKDITSGSLTKFHPIICRTVTLDQATDSAKIIGKAALNMFHSMKLNISDMRGVSV